MKKVALVISVSVMTLASCDTYRVCPTYLKNNQQPVQQIKSV